MFIFTLDFNLLFQSLILRFQRPPIVFNILTIFCICRIQSTIASFFDSRKRINTFKRFRLTLNTLTIITLNQSIKSLCTLPKICNLFRAFIIFPSIINNSILTLAIISVICTVHGLLGY
jgi:hypothetical protein